MISLKRISKVSDFRKLIERFHVLLQGSSRPGPTENSADVENILKVSEIEIEIVNSRQRLYHALRGETLPRTQQDEREVGAAVDKPIFSPIQRPSLSRSYRGCRSTESTHPFRFRRIGFRHRRQRTQFRTLEAWPTLSPVVNGIGQPSTLFFFLSFPLPSLSSFFPLPSDVRIDPFVSSGYTRRF